MYDDMMVVTTTMEAKRGGSVVVRFCSFAENSHGGMVCLLVGLVGWLDGWRGLGVIVLVVYLVFRLGDIAPGGHGSLSLVRSS
jgi:hypothetical protein